MSLIECINIRKEFNHSSTATVALRDVSLLIENGEFVAIMGPSGSGKSTLLHILSALDIPSAGVYKFNNIDVRTLNDNELANLRNSSFGFVFQAFHLLSRTNVFQNVLLPLMYSTIPESEWKTRALNSIDSVGLSHRLKHGPSELSGGEKQRVAIARALVCNPSVIFADEPTGNLDSQSGKMIMNSLNELHKKHGRTIIVITHDQKTAEYADRIIMIKDGSILSDKLIAR